MVTVQRYRRQLDLCKCGQKKGTNPNCTYCKQTQESRTLGE